MANTGFVLGRNVAVRQIIVPDGSANLIYTPRDDEKLIQIDSALYDLMTADTLAQLSTWLVSLTSTQYQALTDQDVSDQINAILAAST